MQATSLARSLPNNVGWPPLYFREHLAQVDAYNANNEELETAQCQYGCDDGWSAHFDVCPDNSNVNDISEIDKRQNDTTHAKNDGEVKRTDGVTDNPTE